MRKRLVIIITGMSGAGQSTTLKILEDLGYEALDNLPLFLLPPLLAENELLQGPLAVRIDTRTRDFSGASVIDEVRRLRIDSAFAARLVYLTADDDVLQRRYIETRRRHPLAIDRPVSDGIRRERQLFSALVDEADLVLDTSDLNIHELKRLVAGEFSLITTPELHVSVMSFSYRLGLPREADLVFDVRFLRNPHYDPALKALTGKDGVVGDYIKLDQGFVPFFQRLAEFVLPLLPRYRSEGKSYLTIAIGCTGGQHRSVFIAEELAKSLTGHASGVTVHHRDLERALSRLAKGESELKSTEKSALL